MLIWLLNRLTDTTTDGGATAALSGLRSPGVRAAIAAALCLLLALALGPRLIAWLRKRCLEPDKCTSSALRALHQGKRQTPTMGGVFLIAGLTAAVLLLADLRNPLILLALGLATALAALGAIDDLVKLRTAAAGITPRTKLLVQTAIAAATAAVLYGWQTDSHGAAAVWFPGAGFAPVAWWYFPLATLVIVGSSNAVNLTDGLDGLACGALLFAIAALAVLLCLGPSSAPPADAAQTQISGELLVVAGAMTGGIFGFLWFNWHPAQVFMGNTGALALGGLLALLALAARRELLLVVIGGVFVVEAASVLVQIGVYKLRGRRLLRCAPLHHHFELAGWPETTIVVRFWIAAGLCAVAGVTLGLL
jgi:phospho-N-acetylmuramoyl-pentapeptide-transferase